MPGRLRPITSKFFIMTEWSVQYINHETNANDAKRYMTNFEVVGSLTSFMT